MWLRFLTLCVNTERIRANLYLKLLNGGVGALSEKLKQDVYEANMLLPAYGLVTFTWGNASAVDRERRIVVIKPSGVEYEKLSPDKMVVLNLDDGRVIEGELSPSSDTPSHLELYRAFPEISGIVHTHSRYAASFAQAMRSIPVFGTTHADYFYGAVLCTRVLSESEVKTDYEANTGKVICETIAACGTEVLSMGGILVANHGPFAWGSSAKDAVHNAAVMEEVAVMAMNTMAIAPEAPAINQYICDKHYFRKHGKSAYYGQK